MRRVTLAPDETQDLTLNDVPVSAVLQVTGDQRADVELAPVAVIAADGTAWTDLSAGPDFDGSRPKARVTCADANWAPQGEEVGRPWRVGTSRWADCGAGRALPQVVQ